jgi:glycosyltransferase involved in cell wall biosynthesis
MATDNSLVDVSIVIPVYNEAENLEPLMAEIKSAVDAIGCKYEVIFVDDKSTDDSLTVMRRLKAKHAEIVIVRHKENCGESAAQASGFQCAGGKVIITMDGDGQNDPADIPLFLATLTDDVDCVCGVRQKREDNWVRRISSRIANWFRNFLTGDKITDAGCTYRAIRRSVLTEIMVFNGMHRFLPTILRFQRRNVIEIKVNHRPRRRGISQYGIGNRMWRGILDCLAMRWYKRRALPSARYYPPE